VDRSDISHYRSLSLGLAAVAGLTLSALRFFADDSALGIWGLVVAAGYAGAAVMARHARLTLVRAANLALAIAIPATAPFLISATEPTATTSAMLIAFPVAVAFVAFDDLLAVLAASATGLLANLGALVWVKTPTMQLAELGVGMLGLYSVGCVGAWSVRRIQRRGLELEQERNRALRLAEERRSQTERLTLVGKLAAGVAHEINNPLAFVKANLGVLGRALAGEEKLEAHEAREIVEETNDGITRIATIVSDLRIFAKDDTQSVDAVEVRDVIRGIVRLAGVRVPAAIKLEIDTPSGITLVRANQHKLAQILLNLVMNAAESILEVRKNGEGGVIRVAASVDESGVRIDVSDNGAGIDPRVQSRLFEPFFTTKPPGLGTGLGLTLSREDAQSFGATISGRTLAGGGALFAVHLEAIAVTGEHQISTSGPHALR
jgi:C4-dicarboxylate-specific signal transduction histidine kinase